jgi:predicted nicotinamide N-methyase
VAAASLADFIRSRTAVAAPPLIPEIRLHLSREEPTALWERTERETGRSDLPPPFWAYPCAGGIALARYLLDHPERAAGRVVLDLASGSGLVAVAAARAGAARVIASDIDPMAVAAIALNAAVNDVDILVTDADLLTGDGAGGAGGGVVGGGAAGALLAGQANLPAPDLVVVGDACYERRLAHRMLAFLRRAQSAGASALLCDPGRAYLPATGLEPLARYVVPAWPGLEDAEVKESRVWQLASGG